jgi:serpin B
VDYKDPEMARRKINLWVEENTQKMITEVIPPGFLDALTSLVLVNAIYFKGNWKCQFDRSLTRGAPFWVKPDEQIQVAMMNQKRRFRYAESAVLQVLELPYSGNDLSMTVLLPKATDGLTKLEEALTVKNLDRWTRDLREMEVDVSLPGFEVTLPFRLDDTLKAMGMMDAFSSKADFSGIGEKPLFISACLHKAFIAVNEEGTEAAAATTTVTARGLSPLPPTFRADHPFVYLIRESSTGSILFLGRVVIPQIYRPD